MNSWDKKYLKKVEESDLVMKVYSRYVDDSNQVTMVPDDHTPQTTIQKLLEIANSIEDGIVMEVDIVDNHDDLKLPILDMKCWVDSEGFAQYMHYEKPVSSKLVISERSAHANGCRSVHMNELDRRMSNTSQGPNWEERVAPALSDYMSRMKSAGYNENYRKMFRKVHLLFMIARSERQMLEKFHLIDQLDTENLKGGKKRRKRKRIGPVREEIWHPS